MKKKNRNRVETSTGRLPAQLTIEVEFFDMVLQNWADATELYGYIALNKLLLILYLT